MGDLFYAACWLSVCLFAGLLKKLWMDLHEYSLSKIDRGHGNRWCKFWREPDLDPAIVWKILHQCEIRTDLTFWIISSQIHNIFIIFFCKYVRMLLGDGWNRRLLSLGRGLRSPSAPVNVDIYMIDPQFKWIFLQKHYGKYLINKLYILQGEFRKNNISKSLRRCSNIDFFFPRGP